MVVLEACLAHVIDGKQDDTVSLYRMARIHGMHRRAASLIIAPSATPVQIGAISSPYFYPPTTPQYPQPSNHIPAL